MVQTEPLKPDRPGAGTPPGPWWQYPGAALAVGAVTTFMVVVRDQLNTLNVALIYVLLCLGTGLAAGRGPAVAVAILAFLAFDFFFIPPYNELTVAREHHVLALVAFLLVAIISGQLVALVRQQTRDARREQHRLNLLYELNAALIGGVGLDAILETIVERLVTIYGSTSSRILLPEGDGLLSVVARHPLTEPGTIDRANQAVAGWVMEHGSPAGRGGSGRRLHWLGSTHRTGPLPPSVDAVQDVLYLPIAAGQRMIGVLEVTGRPGGGRFRPEDEALLVSFANQAALAIDRARLTEEAARAAALAQSDELKSALLAAVSHDLRTPLASIKAAATSLLDDSVTWSEAARADLLDTIDEETDRLAGMVANLLDLSRIEGGALRPDKAWYDVSELIADVVRRQRVRAADHPLAVDIEPDLPLVEMDYIEISQVLVNLIENAIKYTPAGTPITVSARRSTISGRPVIEVAVADHGPGIPAEQQSRLFEKFYRGAPHGAIPGSGIGLTISKGLVEAHGGRLWLASEEGVGATFRFTLPLADSARPNGTEAIAGERGAPA